MKPATILKTEGLFVLAISVILYLHLGADWWLMALLFFVPDLFMLGYVFDRRVGAFVYNVGHTYTFTGVFFLLALVTKNQIWFSVGLIWTAHIGFDRMLGYGLKFSSGFKHTHPQAGDVGNESKP